VCVKGYIAVKVEVLYDSGVANMFSVLIVSAVFCVVALNSSPLTQSIARLSLAGVHTC